MSEIDTRLGAGLRDSYLSEVRSWLPAFLGGGSIERTQPLDNVAELFALEPRVLRRVVAVHIVRHDTIQRFVNSLRRGLRSPATGSERPRQYSRVLSGGIDWAATTRARATSSPTEVGFVTRNAVRAFDLPENRILKWVIMQVRDEAELATLYQSPDAIGWRGELADAGRRITQATRTTWLRDVPVSSNPHYQMRYLKRSRYAFYRIVVENAAKTLLRYRDPTPDDVASLLVERWFEPARDWALFEFVVLLRIHRALTDIAERMVVRTSAGIGQRPFAEYRTATGAHIRLWYQRWPSSSGPSELLDAAAHHGIRTAGSRPDIVLEHEDGGVKDAAILEMKATKNAEYLASGLLQLLGYLRDRPALFRERPNGWLIGPDDASIARGDSGSRDLWALRADDVGSAVVAWALRH